MPRLLLVDDNPSIHKIAETLLAGSDIALACVASGAEALALLEKGEPFDVAMIDISMMGMSGWELLARMREQEATALMPVALMAGVLDVVDPDQLRQAPIQGFFKKPVELRDLAERVHRLLETPVQAPEPPAPEAPAPPSAFATMPGFRVADLGIQTETAAAVPDDLLILGPDDLYPGEATTKTTDVPRGQDGFDPLEDSLDLEELDLDSLRELTPGPESLAEPPAAPAFQDGPQAALEPAPAAPEELEDFGFGDELLEASGQIPPPDVERISTVPDFAPGDTATEGELAGAEADPASQLPDLFPAPGAGQLEPEFLDWTEDSDTLLPPLPSSGTPPQEFDVADVASSEAITLSDILDPGPMAPETSAPPATELSDSPTAAGLELADELFDTPEPSPWQEAPNAFDDMFGAPTASVAAEDGGAAESEAKLAAEDDGAAEPEAIVTVPAALPAQPEPVLTAPAAGATPDLLAALLADPVFMEQLTKAVVARLGDQALREIAWEVIPELAERLQRN